LSSPLRILLLAVLLWSLTAALACGRYGPPRRTGSVQRETPSASVQRRPPPSEMSSGPAAEPAESEESEESEESDDSDRRQP